MEIILYTTHCPKCIVLEKKLNAKNIKFEICEDANEIRKAGFLSAPVLKVGDEFLEFSDANDWVNKQ